MKRLRKHWAALFALVFALSVVLGVGVLSASAEEPTWGSVTDLEGYERYSGSLTNPDKNPVTKDADWASSNLGNLASVADSIDMSTEGYAYYVDLEYYKDSQWAGSLEMRLRNNWRDAAADRVALLTVSAGGVTIDPWLFAVDDSTKSIPVDGYGWHHVRAKLTQTASAIPDGESGKYSLSFDFRMTVYVDGVEIRTFEANDGVFESHHFYLYCAKVDPDTGVITYKSVKELYNVAKSGTDEEKATLADYGYGATAADKTDTTYLYAYSGATSGLFNRKDGFAGMQRIRALTVSWGSQAAFEVSPIKYNLNGGSLATEAPIVEPQNNPAAVKGGYTWVGVPGATYAFTEVDHYYVDDGSGKTVTPADAGKLGQALLGWYTDEALTSAYDVSTPKTGAVTLYAKYAEAGRFALTVDLLDGKTPTVGYPTGESFILGDEADLWIATDGKAYAPGETLTLTKDTAIYPVSVELMKGASVRLDASHSGLRFESRISLALYDALYESCGIFDWEIGTLILPTDVLGEGTLTLSTERALRLHNLTNGVSLAKDNELGTVTFYAAIVDILPQNYVRSFTAVSYLKIGDKTVYSESTSRSIYEVAVEAYEGAYAGNAIVTGYLNKVISLTGAFRQLVASGYVSPYTVSWADNVLTVAKKEGSFASKDEISSIVINGTVYTDGWSLSDGKLVAPYKLELYYDLNGITYADAGNAVVAAGTAGATTKMTHTSFVINAGDSDWDRTTISCTDGEGKSLDYISVTMSGYDKCAGTANLSGKLGTALGESYTKVTYSMSLMIPEGYTKSPSCSFMLRRDGTSTRAGIFNLGSDTVTLSGGAVIGELKAGEFVDISVTIDFVTGTLYGYCNGELTATAEGVVKVPSADQASYASLLAWAKANTKYWFNGANLNNNNGDSKAANDTSKVGICFDNISVRVH